MQKVLAIGFLLLCVETGVFAQEVTKHKICEGYFTKEYAEKDNGELDGEYKLYYKDQLIEKGQYDSGVKTGKWRYFSFNNILEYEYDFEREAISIIGGEKTHGGHVTKTPCFYHGSPLIPYLFMVNNVFYPKGAIEDELSGRVELTLKIDKEGKVYGYYISKKLHYVLDRAVMDAASKMPDSWTFLPATRNGHPLISEYPIPIEFELSL